jgi:hypothetical protein
VIGIRLAGGDAVAGCAIATVKDDLIITTSRGKSKLIKGKLFKGLGRATGGYGVFHVVKNEQVTALIKPHQRITVPEVEDDAPAQLQLELVEEKPANRAKLTTKAQPPRKARAKVK